MSPDVLGNLRDPRAIAIAMETKRFVQLIKEFKDSISAVTSNQYNVGVPAQFKQNQQVCIMV